MIYIYIQVLLLVDWGPEACIGGVYEFNKVFGSIN